MNLGAVTWRTIPGFENYEVSSDGRVRKGRTGRVLRLVNRRDGYVCAAVFINKKRFTRKVHRLVALAFIPNPDHKPEVNHRNGNKSDNQVGNLEWATKRENSLHYHRELGTSAACLAALALARQKALASTLKLTPENVLTIRAEYSYGKAQELAARFGVTNGCILHAVSGRTHASVGGGES
jgi:hypothetical protein